MLDGFKSSLIKPSMQKAIIHGETHNTSIAAASILAKVYRDNLMQKMHLLYPNYNFLENKGYGTAGHRLALKKHGLSPQHRTSFQLQKYL